jgi:hypothetical protein
MDEPVGIAHPTKTDLPIVWKKCRVQAMANPSQEQCKPSYWPAAKLAVLVSAFIFGGCLIAYSLILHGTFEASTREKMFFFGCILTSAVTLYVYYVRRKRSA